jgi:hypothetical protein
MAVVHHLAHVVLENDVRHTDVDCTYSVVTQRGAKYLQIDTYGSATRKIPGKKSQSIRFSPEGISELKKILAEQF